MRTVLTRSLLPLATCLVALALPPIAGAAAASPSITTTAGIAYASTGGTTLRLDVTRPRSGSGRPLLVLVHGGGWRVGDRGQWARNGWTAPFARAGFVVVTPSYRLACDAERAIELRVDPDLCGGTMMQARADVTAAVRWAVRNARRLGADPRQVVLVGASAGAQLALLASLHPSVNANVRAVAAISPPADLPAIGRSRAWLEGAVTTALRCSWQSCPDRWRALSPHAALARAARVRLRPTYLFASRRDLRVPWSSTQALARLLARRGSAVALHEPGVRMSACHGPWACERHPVAGTRLLLKAHLLRWLRATALTPARRSAARA